MTYNWCGNFCCELFFGSTLVAADIVIDPPGELSVMIEFVARRTGAPLRRFKAASGAVRSLPAAIRLMASSNRKFGRADTRVLSQLSAHPIFGRADTLLRQ
jgi:hypothetical protein